MCGCETVLSCSSETHLTLACGFRAVAETLQDSCVFAFSSRSTSGPVHVCLLKEADVRLRFNSWPADLLGYGGQRMIGVWCTTAVSLWRGVMQTAPSGPAILTSIWTNGLWLLLCFISSFLFFVAVVIAAVIDVSSHSSSMCSGGSIIISCSSGCGCRSSMVREQ